MTEKAILDRVERRLHSYLVKRGELLKEFQELLSLSLEGGGIHSREKLVQYQRERNLKLRAMEDLERVIRALRRDFFQGRVRFTELEVEFQKELKKVLPRAERNEELFQQELERINRELGRVRSLRNRTGRRERGPRSRYIDIST